MLFRSSYLEAVREDTYLSSVLADCLCIYRLVCGVLYATYTPYLWLCRFHALCRVNNRCRKSMRAVSLLESLILRQHTIVL